VAGRLVLAVRHAGMGWGKNKNKNKNEGAEHHSTVSPEPSPHNVHNAHEGAPQLTSNSKVTLQKCRAVLFGGWGCDKKEVGVTKGESHTPFKRYRAKVLRCGETLTYTATTAATVRQRAGIRICKHTQPLMLMPPGNSNLHRN
jgi:hypothetical protein